MIDQNQNQSQSQSQSHIVAQQLGGTTGMIYTAVPIVVFVIANSIAPLPITIGVAIAVAVAIAVLRVVRGEQLMTALGGVFGVAAAGAVAAATGSADGYFLIGIWASLAGAVITGASLIARRPLTGLLWNALHGNKHPWRQDRPVLRAHDLATLTLTVLFAARFVVQQQLYDADATGWLGVSRIGMGFPLLALALVVVVWAFRRSSKRLTDDGEHTAQIAD
ncbi:DUF3159 domain-containing protein [Gordonia sp. SL306]|uniref:DUF3159 domain-containing protein n=1 Tax=Gordonia sp. SL306 TaxID=2995145 RepID=UPI00226E5708|nr:DUF3159 domain-containing protein [Gordonia sp. SL306]WAC57136.1 DUF3159 domain-containing protein [Gordonia sp. SL306]